MTAQVRRLGKYILGDTLGQGGFSKVKLGTHEDTNLKVALKILKRDKLATNSSTQRQVEREIEAMRKIQHPNVIRLYEVDWNARYMKKNGTIIDVILVVLELATGGELFEFLSFTGCFEESVARTYFHQLTAGLQSCHSQGIAHRDLKPENLLLDSHFTLKVADFGFAHAVNEHMPVTFTECGTPGYMAPEMLTHRGYDPYLADLWSCGVIVFIMLAGFPPFQKPNETDWWFDKLAKGKHALFWQAHCRSARFSDSFKDFINKLLLPDPSKRMRMEDIKRHPWYLGETIIPNVLSAEFQRRKQTVDYEKAKQKLHKDTNSSNNSGALDGVTVRSLEKTGSGESENENELPNFPPAFNVWKQNALELPPAFGRPSSVPIASFTSENVFAESKQSTLAPMYVPEEGVSCYTRFYTKLPADQLLARVSNALSSEFQGNHVVVDDTFKIKGKVMSDNTTVYFQAQVYNDPVHAGLTVCEFKRRKGEGVQFRQVFQNLLDSLSSVLVVPDQLS